MLLDNTYFQEYDLLNFKVMWVVGDFSYLKPGKNNDKCSKAI